MLKSFALPTAWGRRALVLFLACSVVVSRGATAMAEGTPLTVTSIARDGQLLVSFEFAEGLTDEVQDAIHSGLPTTFSYDVELRRGGLGWFDRTVAAVTISASVRFDNLTRRYQMSRSVDGRVEDARPTEDQDAVRRWMTRFEHVPVSTVAVLEANMEYYVRVRAHARPQNAWFLWPWERGSVLGHAKFTFIP